MDRIFVVGDIHGCYDELLELIDKIAFDEHDLLISVGDIVDRGNKSLEVYHFFRDLPNAKIIMGNHERKHLNGVLSYAQEIVKLQFKNEYAEFIEWLKDKRYYFEFDDLIVIHAALEYDKKLEDQNDSVLCGSTAGEKYLQAKLKANTFWNDYYFGEKTIVYGHSVVGDDPKIYNNTIGIDTGACHGGLLTAVEFPGQIIHQIHSKKDYWKEEQQKWQLPILKGKKWNLLDFKAFEKLKDKLSYVEDAEVKAYLKELEDGFSYLKKMQPIIISEIEKLTRSIIDEDIRFFNEMAKKYSFSSLIFQSKSGKLPSVDLEKRFGTPLKILLLMKELNLQIDIRWEKLFFIDEAY